MRIQLSTKRCGLKSCRSLSFFVSGVATFLKESGGGDWMTGLATAACGGAVGGSAAKVKKAAENAAAKWKASSGRKVKEHLYTPLL